MLTCDFESTKAALGVHEDIFEIAQVVEEMITAFVPAIFVGSQKNRIHALCNFNNLICLTLLSIGMMRITSLRCTHYAPAKLTSVCLQNGGGAEDPDDEL